MTLDTGFPVGNGMLLAMVLPPMPIPMLAPALAPGTTQSGRSAGNAEATKAIEKDETMLSCFILVAERKYGFE